MNRILKVAALATIGFAALGASASASVSMDDAGHGFVGKGDVQTALGGLNNAQIQTLPVNFTVKTVTEQPSDWSCTKTVTTGNGTVKETVQERANVVTTDVSGVVSSVARVKNQITGWNLDGFGTKTTTTAIEGPALGSCADANSGFVFDDNLSTGDVAVISTGLFVNGVSLPITPAI